MGDCEGSKIKIHLRDLLSIVRQINLVSQLRFNKLNQRLCLILFIFLLSGKIRFIKEFADFFSGVSNRVAKFLVFLCSLCLQTTAM